MKLETLKKNLFTSLLMTLAAGFLLVGCKDDDNDTTPEPSEPTLYQKLGGTNMVEDPANGGIIEQGRLGLRSVVDSSILVIAGDTTLQPYFESLLNELGNGNATNLAILSENLTDFFVMATGGNAQYEGLDMVAAHDPEQNPRMAMKADDAAFDAFIAAVGTGATQNDVPAELIGEVAALIETLRDPVVQK